MARFEDAIATVLEHEGGLSNHPNDPGGLTNRGITLTTFRKIRGASATPDELRGLSADQAADIYRLAYWLPVYDLIDDQDVATKLFDQSVNMGHMQAHKLIQRACTDCSYHLNDDGVIGPMTLAAVNSIPPHDLLLSMCHQQIAFYRSLVELKPGFAVFLDGWLKRASWVGPRNEQGVA
jgi:lysozyme family protein